VSSEGTRQAPSVAGEAVEPIAIVGAACRLPGAAGLDAFWRLLHGGVDAIRPITRDGLDPARFYDARPKTPGHMATRWGGFLDDIEKFDADFFGISPREAEKLDPSQRLLLETAWEACEDAGIDAKTLSGTPVGVFVGQWVSDFENRLFENLNILDLHATNGSGRYASAGRLSYFLGLNGPSISIDTACSSSLVAVHLACQSLRARETPLAFAGGVNVILQPQITIAYSQGGMMAPDGRCKFGDADGDGYVRSEGVGLLLLKRLSDAMADGDLIHAVIRGSAVNNDGNGSGHLGRPSREGQAAMIRTAYANAGVAPSSVGYVEAHGTGTRVGDPVEINALGDVLAAGREAGGRCYIGSVKTNIGHTEGAAGIAGLIKAMLALEHGVIPPSLHLKTPNPKVPWADLPFEIPKQPVAWPRSAQPRIIGVNTFGIAGTNAHVVIEEAPRAAQRAVANADASTPLPLLLSASSRPALRAMATSYADLLRASDAPSPRDIAASAAHHRTSLGERAVFIAADPTALVEKLCTFAEGDDQGADAVRRADADRRRVAFVFPGQGGQWLGMGRELLATNAVFADTVAQCDGALPAGATWTIREQLLAEPGEHTYRLNQIAVLQPVLVVVEIALASVWRSLGVEPDAVVGHSMGEVGAAYFAGALSLADAMGVICERSRLLQRMSGAGAMAMLELSADAAAERIAPYGDRLSVAVVNGPRSTVVSGDSDAVAALRDACEREGIFCRAVQVDVASHSRQMDSLVPELVDALARLTPRDETIPLYSTVDATRLSGTRFDAGYWGQNLRWPVQFATAVERMLEDGIDAFIEVSPHPALLASIAQIADARRVEGARQPIALGTLRRNEPERANVFANLGGLWAAGHPVDWTRVFARDSYTRVTLPTYPWQRERYWPELGTIGAVPNSAATLVASTEASLDDAHRHWMYVTEWRPAPVQGSDTPRRWLLVGNARELRPLADALAKRGGAATAVATVDEAARTLREIAGEHRDVGIVSIADVDDPHLAWRSVEMLRTLQNAQDAGATVPRLWWITRGAHRVADEAVSTRAAEQGALWGAARVIATESPDWWGGLVDLEAETLLQLQADTLAGHLTAARREDQVAIRNGQRFAVRMARADVSLTKQPTAYPWRADGAYLITGGFGDVSQAIALEMARQGARRIVLLGRGALPPRPQWPMVPSADPIAKRIAFVRELEHAGASVHVLQADVSNPAQLEAAVGSYVAEGWPSIVGVIHAAAVVDSRLIQDMDASAFERVLRPKLAGAIALDRLFPTLDLFVLFSSMSAFWAPAGMSNYAAANAGLDALAVARRARGQRAVSIQWGPWEDLGIYRGATEQGATSDLGRDGVSGFSMSEGTRFIAPILAGDASVVAVLPVDWSKFAAARRGREPSLFRELLATPAAEQRVASSADGLRSRLAATPDIERRAMLEQAIRSALSAVLRRPADQLDMARPFGTMGLDSLMALEFRSRLESAIEHALPATIAWNYPTLALLLPHLETLVAEDIASAPAPTAPRATPTDLLRVSGEFAIESMFGDVAELSDEDAARALRRGA
jgi:acyl transferase domain-containing protein